MSDDNEKAAKTAGALSRHGIVTLLFGDEKEQISIERLRTRLSESLDAKETKAFKTQEVVYTPRGREIKSEFVIYSDPLVDHRARLAAQKMCFELLDAFPSQKHEMEHTLKGTVNLEARLNEAMRRKAKHGESSGEDQT